MRKALITDATRSAAPDAMTAAPADATAGAPADATVEATADAAAGAPANATAAHAAPEATAPDVRFRMRVRYGDDIVLGPGKVALLEAIRKAGSISAAARDIGMSYRRAWLLLDELNRSLDAPATVSTHGGRRRGGSALTPVGEQIVRLYRDIEDQSAAHCREQITALISLIKVRGASL